MGILDIPGVATVRTQNGAASGLRLGNAVLPARPKGTAKNTLVILGDSITRQYANASSTPNVYSSAGSFVAWMNAFLKRRFHVVNNAGVSGDTTAQMLARIQTDVLAYSPDYCTLFGGVNDIVSSVPYATTIANLTTIISTLLGAGIRPILFTIPPNSGTVGTGGTLTRVALEKINEFIRQQEKTNAPVYVVDWAGAATNSDGTSIAGGTIDNVHPGPLLGLNCGWVAKDRLDGFIPKIVESRTNQQGTNLVSNGRLMGNNASGANGFGVGTGVTGNGPNGWFAARTGSALVAALSKVASLDYRQDTRWQVNITTGGADNDRIQLSYTVNFRLAVPSAAVLDTTRFYVPQTGAHYRAIPGGTGQLASNADPTTWLTDIGVTFPNGTATLQCCEPIVPGDIMQMFADCNVSALTAGAFVPRLNANFKNTAGTSQLILISAQDEGGTFPGSWPYPSNFILETPPVALPAGFDLANTTSSAGPSLVVTLEAYTKAGTNCTFSWADVYCGKVV